MTIYYIDPTWAGTKSGTFAAPYSAYSSVTAPVPGDFILLKAGTTFNGNVAAVSTKSGLGGNPITYGVYDATTGAQITTTVGAATINGAGTGHVFATNGESYIEIVGIRITGVASASYAGMRLGSNSTGATDGCFARYCAIENQTCFAGILIYTNSSSYGHGVDHCQINTNSQYGIYFDGSLTSTKALITNNTCSFNGRSGIRAALSSGSVSISGSISNNTCNSNGVTTATIPYGIGIDVVSNIVDMTYSGNTCNDNYLSGMFLGNFTGTSATNQFLASRNTCLRNGEFGIIVSKGGGWVVALNTCNYNGADRGNHYGRGIEIFGGSGQPAGPGVVCFNTCCYNYNYGGTINNGTEGCGIGLDDYHKDVQVFGNLLMANEGNGIQFNPNGASGSNKAYGNILIDNFAAPTSRAASWADYLKSQAYSGTTENGLSFYNNHVLLTQANAPACVYGLSETNTATGTGTTFINNLFKGHGVAMKVRDTTITRNNNGFYGNTVRVQSNASTTTLSDGTGAQTADPQLDSNYRPASSSYKGAGAYIGGRDYVGNPFVPTPSIGAIEIGALALRYSLK